MQTLDDIEYESAQDPSCELLTRAAELDHAELVERVPELQRQNAESVWRQFGRYAPSWATPDTFASFLILPTHPAVGRYRAALEYAPGHSPASMTYKVARARFDECAEDFYQRCDLRRGEIVSWSDGGKFVSLRAILEAEHAMVKACDALQPIQKKERTRLIRAKNKRELNYWREQLAM